MDGTRAEVQESREGEERTSNSIACGALMLLQVMLSRSSDQQRSLAVEDAPKPKSRLAAIVFLDAVGSSAAMAQSELLTLQEIDRAITFFAGLVSAKGGQVLNFTGDGALAAFESAAALACALEFQTEMGSAHLIGFRAGVHLGEIYQEGDRTYGDSINVAERLQAVELGHLDVE